MEDFANKSLELVMPGETESKREWFIGVVGACVCYGLIIWLL